MMYGPVGQYLYNALSMSVHVSAHSTILKCLLSPGVRYRKTNTDSRYPRNFHHAREKDLGSETIKVIYEGQ